MIARKISQKKIIGELLYPSIFFGKHNKYPYDNDNDNSLFSYTELQCRDK